jgi:hypothetical protein
MNCNIPDESVYFLDGVFDLVIGVSGFDTQLKYESIDFVDNKSYADTFLESMPKN